MVRKGGNEKNRTRTKFFPDAWCLDDIVVESGCAGKKAQRFDSAAISLFRTAEMARSAILSQ